MSSEHEAGAIAGAHPVSRAYPYHDASPSHTHAYLWPTVMREIEAHFRGRRARRVFDLGCGNGALAAMLHGRGLEVVGVDPSRDGVAVAKAAHPELTIDLGSSDDPLAVRYGRFPAVVSLEVVEHVYSPRIYARCVHDLVEDGGIAIISTPYHGYLKNLVLAATGRMDRHFTALWENGHIKFWSERTLHELLLDAGFSTVRFWRVGRFPALAKSMVAIATRGDAAAARRD